MAEARVDAADRGYLVTLVEDACAAAEGLDRDIPLAQAIQSFPGWAEADDATRRRVRHYVNATFELIQ